MFKKTRLGLLAELAQRNAFKTFTELVFWINATK